MIPIWMFVLTCILFLFILIHQNNRLLESYHMHTKTWEVLKKYIKKYGIDEKIIKEIEKYNP